MVYTLRNFIFLSLIFFFLLSCSEIERVEIKRVSSADGIYQASIERDSGLGAFDRFTYSIFIEKYNAQKRVYRSKPVGFIREPSLTESNDVKIDLLWEENNKLVILTYNAGRAEFNNGNKIKIGKKYIYLEFR